MSRADIDRTIAPLSFGQAAGDRWDLIDPELIVASASPRHQQSVLEDARATVRQLVGALRFSLATLLMPEGNRGAVHVREAEEAARRAIAWATGSGALPESIAWHKLDEADFAEVHAKVDQFLWSDHARRFLWPHLTPQQTYDMVDQFLTEFS